MRNKFSKNEIILFDDHAEIVLYDKHNQEKARAIIDLENVDIVRPAKWYQRPDGYVATNNYDGMGYCYLHTLLTGKIIDRKYCDHKDGNRLNNRYSNFRIANPPENGMNKRIRSNNTSGIVGVHWNKENEKWCAMICAYGQHINLGYFDKIEDAAACRKAAEKKYFGEYQADETRTRNRELI